MAAGMAVMGTISLDVGVADPGEISGQVAIAGGTKDQMPMVGHEAKTEQLDVGLVLGVEEELDERLIIRRLAEKAPAAVAAIEDMIDHPAHGGARCAWHEQKNYRNEPESSILMDATFSEPLSTIYGALKI